MVLQRQIVDVPIGMGLDESTGSYSVQPGRLLTAENCRIVDPGTLEQRPGYVAMTNTTHTGGSITTARRLYALGDEIVLDDGINLHSYSTDLARWLRLDKVPEVSVAERIAGERGSDAIGCRFDAICGHGLIITAHNCANGYGTAKTLVRVRVIDAVTGARSQAAEYVCQTDSDVRVLLNEDSNACYLFYEKNNGAGGVNIVGRILDLTNPLAGWSAETIVSGLVHVTVWDVCVTDSGFMLAYDDQINARIELRLLSEALVVLSTVSGTDHAVNSVSVVCDSTAGRTYVTYHDSTAGQIRVDGFNAAAPLALAWTVTLYAVVAAGRVAVQSAVVSGGVYVVSSRIAIAGSVAPCHAALTVVSSAGAVTSGPTYTYHVQACGTLYKYGTKIYSLVYLPGPADATTTGGIFTTSQYGAYLCEWEAGRRGRPVCRMGWSQAFAPEQGCSPGLRTYDADTKILMPVGMLSESLDSVAASTTRGEGFDLYVLDFDPRTTPLGVEEDGELAFSGGLPSVYCGDRVAEYGFNYGPGALQASQVGGAGSLTNGAAYQYAVVYTWRDSRGVTSRSLPMVANITIAAPGNVVNLYWPTYTLTTRTDADDDTYQVLCEVFRSDDNGQSMYHIATVQSDPAAIEATYQDTGTFMGAALLARRGCYTNGLVVENVAPPPMRHLIDHNNRLWCISADDPDTIWFSKLVSLREQPGWYEGFKIRVPGADLTALASLDGKLIAFASKGIYAVFGSGPSDTDQNNDLSEPQLVSRELGCIDPRSVCVFPGGVMFQAQDGLLYVLGSDMQPKCVSLPVTDILHANPIINAVTYHPDAHEIRVVATKTFLATSTTLVWNVLYDQWHRWRLKNSTPTTDPPIASAAVVQWQGAEAHALLQTNGIVLRESGSTDPDTTYPTITLRTAWMRLSSLQGYIRCWRAGLLFEKITAAAISSTVTLTGYLNYRTTQAFTASWDAAGVTAALQDTRLQLLARVPIAAQKCESIQLGISWAPVNGKTLKLHGLSFELGAKQGPPRVHAAAARK